MFDDCCNKFTERAQSNYAKRGGAKALPWADILAALLELVTKCFLSRPAANDLRTLRPFQKVRLAFALRPFPDRSLITEAVIETAKESSDEEAMEFYSAACECCA